MAVEGPDLGTSAESAEGTEDFDLPLRCPSPTCRELIGKYMCVYIYRVK